MGFTPKVLYIENDGISQLLTKKILTELGCHFHYEDSTSKGLERIKSEYFDLIITDISMPIMSGVEFTQAVRKLEKSINAEQHIPIVGLTAYQLSKIRASCKAAGMNEILSKPINLTTAKEILKTFVFNAHKGTKKEDVNKELPPLYQLTDYPLLDESEALKIAEDKPTMERILKTLGNVVIPRGVADLRLAHMNQDWQVIYQISNELKGNALTSGAKRMRYACENIENYYESNSHNTLNKLLQQLIHTLLETQRHIFQIIK